VKANSKILAERSYVGFDMGITGRDLLSKLIQSYKCVYPFDYALLDGDGYVLTVRDETTLHYLEHRNVISYEVVFTPPTYVAHLTAKSKYGRMGLSFLNAAKVHSGFVGRLALELVNLSNNRQPITIKRGDPLMHIEYITREGEASPYVGDYMFQYMTDDEVAMYKAILKEQFKNVFDHEWLDQVSAERVRG
jgi:dCTP deaminase